MKIYSSGNRLQDLCNQLQHVSLYKFKTSETQPFAISSPRRTLFSQISKSHNFLISQPNHIPQSPKFIIFHSLSSPPIKTSKKILQMAKPSKKRKGVSTSSAIIGTRSHGSSEVQTTQIPPSISSPTLFSSKEQRIRYNSLFSSRSIIDPKFVDLSFFDDEVFDCF